MALNYFTHKCVGWQVEGSPFEQLNHIQLPLLPPPFSLSLSLSVIVVVVAVAVAATAVVVVNYIVAAFVAIAIVSCTALWAFL